MGLGFEMGKSLMLIPKMQAQKAPTINESFSKNRKDMNIVTYTDL